MKNFDLIHSPLNNVNLIEASAGTGKTYTIAGIFLRLVLEKNLLADSILIVTFTRAATEELRVRIRNNLLRARNGFKNGKSDDPLIDSLIQKSDDPELALQRIKNALIDFDKSAIFTIHGFCHRILHEFAFETRSLFDTELIGDPSELIREVANDYWRHHFYQLPPEIIGYFIDRKKVTGPEHFSKTVVRLLDPNIKIIPEPIEPHLVSLDKYRGLITELRKEWKNERNHVISILKNPALNGRIYGSLKKVQIQSGMTFRDIKVMTLVEKMEHFLDDIHNDFPTFDGFDKLTSKSLKTSTRKNFNLPTHHIFDLCDQLNQCAIELEREMDSLLLFLERSFFIFAGVELQKKKNNQNIRFYDDLLHVLNQAIEEEKKNKNNDLAQMIKSKYKAALIDEFQDTDSLQYKLFDHLFCSGPSIFFMIGDPKQSIYSFRGADVFSYIQASKTADFKSTLTHNYRSDPELITAINTIFTQVKNPFVFHEIPFVRGSSCSHKSHKKNTSNSPFKLWYLKSTDKRPLNKGDAVHMICRATSSEILRLVSDQKAQAGDIAVLVRTNHQARIMKDYLLKKRIPAVIYSAGNVFESSEAEALTRILQAISEPANERFFRAALVTDIIGFKAEELDKMNQDPSRLDDKRALFHQYFTIWNRDGFIRMFYRLIHNENVKNHLLSLSDGDRRLTNILHLSELLHQASLDKKLGMKGLIKWLFEQRYPDSAGKEEHILRLESDESAVKIVTIHKSKGLEYSVVFCPFCWESSRIRNRGIVFHDMDAKNRLTFDLSHQPATTHIMYAQNELLGENLRLLYVALTRAKSKVYLVWGRINTAETSALAYLFHNPWGDQGMNPRENIIQSISKHMKGLTDHDMINNLNSLVKRSNHTIQFLPLPKGYDKKYFSDESPMQELTCERFMGHIDHTWNVSSYSSLLLRPNALSRVTHMPDYDKEQYQTFSHHLNDPPKQPMVTKQKEQRNIFSFPPGIKAGLFFHDIFEKIDFTGKNKQDIEILITRKLVEYGFEDAWKPTVLELVKNILNTPLLSDSDPIYLHQVDNINRISEMEFYFPLNRLTPEILGHAFSLQDKKKSGQDFNHLLRQLDFLPTRGFIKGYMDLVFKRRHRYYILDWKSNDLGPDMIHYKEEALLSAMKKHYYFLQYHIYTLALNQYLKMKDRHYHYKTHFGGIFYIFLRGIDHQKRPEYGIYRDLPDPELIDRLGRALIPDYQ